MQYRVLCFVFALLMGVGTAYGQVAAGCVGPVPTGTGQVVALPETGTINLFFEYADTDMTDVVSATMRFNRVGQAAELSQQVVMKSTITRTGGGNASGSGCYQLPVVPVSQIPRGVAVQATVSVTGGVPELASTASNPTDPFGRRLPPGVTRVKP